MMSETNKIQKLGVFGSFGFNRGDDAIGISLVQGFKNIRPDMHFILPIQREGVFAGEVNVKTFILNRRSVKGMCSLINEIRSVDAVILGAGSMIQDKFGGGYIKGIMGYGWTVSLICKLLGKPTVTGPIGVDELRNKKSFKVAKQFLKRVGKIFVRDPQSQIVAKNILGSQDNREIKVVCDPVFGWSEQNETLNTGKNESYIVFSPAFEGQNENFIQDIFCSLISGFAGINQDIRFKLIAMDEREKEDWGKNTRIKNTFPSEIQARIDLIKPDNPQEAANILRNAQGVVAMRLHSLIIGYGYTKLFCLSRTTKTDALMKTYNVPGIRMSDIVDMDVLIKNASESIFENDDHLINFHRNKLAEMKEKLDSYYKEALDYLEASIAR